MRKCLRLYEKQLTWASCAPISPIACLLIGLSFDPFLWAKTSGKMPLSTLMEVPMINWPTAFVIAVAMVCGVFLINKPTDAALGDGDGMIVGTFKKKEGVWQLRDGKIRGCAVNKFGERPICSAWSD